MFVSLTCLFVQTLAVRVFVEPDKAMHQNPVALARFIGNWFGVFPLKLEELSLPLEASLFDVNEDNSETAVTLKKANKQLKSLNAGSPWSRLRTHVTLVGHPQRRLGLSTC